MIIDLEKDFLKFPTIFIKLKCFKPLKKGETVYRFQNKKHNLKNFQIKFKSKIQDFTSMNI